MTASSGAPGHGRAQELVDQRSFTAKRPSCGEHLTKLAKLHPGDHSARVWVKDDGILQQGMVQQALIQSLCTFLLIFSSRVYAPGHASGLVPERQSCSWLPSAGLSLLQQPGFAPAPQVLGPDRPPGGAHPP